MSEVADGAGQGTDPLWDDWETPPRVPSSPELHLDGFDGPLDLLLDLVERRRIDLRRMSPLAMVGQFADAMERYAAHVALERRPDWLVMAARLMLLRSRLCFPASPEEQEAVEREVRDTHRQIDELLTARAAAAWLDARPQLGHDVFARAGGVRPRVASYMDLMEACLAILLLEEDGWVAPEVAGGDTLLIRQTMLFRVGDVLEAMQQRVATLDCRAPLEEFWPAISVGAPDRPLARRAAMSSTLIAALELGRRGEVLLDQDTDFSPIFVRLAASASVGDKISAVAVGPKESGT